MRARFYCTACNTMHLRTLGGAREGDPCRKCGAACERTTRLAGGTPLDDGRYYFIQIKVTKRVKDYLGARGPNYSRAASDALQELAERT